MASGKINSSRFGSLATALSILFLGILLGVSLHLRAHFNQKSCCATANGCEQCCGDKCGSCCGDECQGQCGKDDKDCGHCSGEDEEEDNSGK